MAFMTRARDPSRIVTALRYLRSIREHFEFDDQERVVKVCISAESGSDQIAAHIGHLFDLRSLTFYRSDVTDEGLRHLARLVNLRELWLYGPKITAAGIAWLGGMSHLEDLYIDKAHGIDLDALRCIARLSSLIELNLDAGSFCEADLAPLAALTNLEKLRLHRNKNINGTFSVHLVALGRFKNLSPGEYITDEGLACVAKLANLEELFLDGPFTDVGLREIRSLEKLRTLYITSDRATDEGLSVIAELPELAWLGLESKLLTDKGAAIIAQCQSLQFLALSKTNLTHAGRKMLRDALPDCEIRDLETGQHSGPGSDVG
jgi:Leucine-rich repeat (LRR) protein